VLFTRPLAARLVADTPPWFTTKLAKLEEVETWIV
jgi:hypothetical protein